MRRLAFASFVLVSVVFVACGGSSAADAKAAGGTPAPDGADGYCCPASNGGGCALVGGYQETGACPTRATLCDNLCDPRIVKDEHGCDKFEYTGCASGSSGGYRPPAADAGNDADAERDASADAGG